MKAQMRRGRKTLCRRADNTMMRQMDTVMGHHGTSLRLWPQADGFPLAVLGLWSRQQLTYRRSSGLRYANSIHMSGHSTQEGEGSIRPPSWYHVHGVQASLVRALGDPGEEHSFPTVIPEAH